MFGRITIIKTLLASQLVYILTPLPTHHNALKDINTLLHKFLWDGKGDKIKRSIMINDYKEGGARMIDIVTFNSFGADFSADLLPHSAAFFRRALNKTVTLHYLTISFILFKQFY